MGIEAVTDAPAATKTSLRFDSTHGSKVAASGDCNPTAKACSSSACKRPEQRRADTLIKSMPLQAFEDAERPLLAIYTMMSDAEAPTCEVAFKACVTTAEAASETEAAAPKTLANCKIGPS